METNQPNPTRKAGRSTTYLVALLSLVAACGSAGGGSNGGISGGSGEAATVTNLVGSVSAMQVGDVYQVLFAGGEKGEIDFDGAHGDAEFVLAVLNLNATGGSQYVQVSGDLNVPVTDVAMTVSKSTDERADWAWSIDDAFHQQRRNVEAALSLEAPALSISMGKAATLGTKAAPTVGTVETFRTLASATSLSQYNEIDAEVRCVGEHIVWYLDSEVVANDSDVMTQADVDALCAYFDSIVEQETAMLGDLSDVNNDGKLAVLQTAQVNRLGASGGGIITGYFLASDLHPRSRANGVSNEREVIYIATPDPAGKYGLTLSKKVALDNLLPAVLPHELQHAISYNQHVLERGGAPEESWLNEGIAHLMEDVFGVGRENPSRYAIYLDKPSSYGLVTPGSPGLAERGGIFLFLRYLYEQAQDSNAFLTNLLKTDRTGLDNLESAFGSTDASFDQFSEFLMRWGATLALNDTGLTSDARYGYDARDWSSIAYSGVCTVCSADDGRGTELEGITTSTFSSSSAALLDSASVQYYAISANHSKIALYSSKGDQYGAVLIRTQ